MKIKISLLVIVLLAAFLRFYRLGSNPPSLYWDEASLGYNAYHLLKTGADEYGVRWPLAIRSFGDFKPPLYAYLAIPSIAVFGLTEFAVRVPSALAGTLTVLLTYFLVLELFGALTSEVKGSPTSEVKDLPTSDKRASTPRVIFGLEIGNCLPAVLAGKLEIAELAALFLAISPWHLQFSRGAFEANLGLFWFVLGILLFLQGLKRGFFLSLAAVAFGLSLYSYHSCRLVAPLLLAGFAWHFRRRLWAQKKAVAASILIGFLLVLPLLGQVISGSAQARFASAGVFSVGGLLDRSVNQIELDRESGHPFLALFHNRRLVFAKEMVKGYLRHWDLNFLFLKGDIFPRHHASGMGLLYLLELPFIFYGIFKLIENRKADAFPLFWWFLAAPAAAAFGDDTPHAIRSLLFLPTFQIFAAFGITSAWHQFIKRKQFRILFFIFYFLSFIFSIGYYLHQYWVHTPIDYASEWQYGYKEAVGVVRGVMSDYEKIIVTDEYDQPYIYFLFYDPDLDPKNYQNDGDDYLGFGKYEFRPINWEKDQNLAKTLLVGTPAEIPQSASGEIGEISYPSGEVAFRIVGLKQ